MAGVQGSSADTAIDQPCIKPSNAVYQPAVVPVHWEKKVKQDLDQDMALGVLEVVQENTPMTWCHRMVICRKHNGDPRRTVDMQKLNNVSVRQCHPTQSPLQQAMTVPHNTNKSVLDAWNGYHNVRRTGTLKPSILNGVGIATEVHRGDAYTHRYCKITMGIKDVKRVIDDTLLYATDMVGAFKQVAEYLTWWASV